MDDGESIPKNEDPEIFGAVVKTALGIVQNYGWLLVAVVVIVLYLRSKFQPRINQWSQQREDAAYKKMDAGSAQSRAEAMERARMRMQAQLDEKAKEFEERQEEREAVKRQQRIEDWEQHLQGKGYRNKSKRSDGPAPPKDKPKPSLKPAYSPLMGDLSGGAGYRPTRRGGASGGG